MSIVRTPQRWRTTAVATAADNNDKTNNRNAITPRLPVIRTADLCGIWTIELQTTTTSTNSSTTPHHAAADNADISTSSSTVVVRLNEDGTFASSLSSASSSACLLSEPQQQQHPSSSNRTSLDLHTILQHGGVWHYRNEEGNHGELILAMTRHP